MRAIRARYNPYLQTRHRVEQLAALGHSVDKVGVLHIRVLSIGVFHICKLEHSMRLSLQLHCLNSTFNELEFCLR